MKKAIAAPRPFHQPASYRVPGPRVLVGSRTTVQHKHFAESNREIDYRFHAHFHPYAGALSRRLVRESVRGLQMFDTEYRQNDDGTFVALPDSTLVTLPDGVRVVTLPDGTQVKLSDGSIVRLPGSILGTAPNGLLLKSSGGTAKRIYEREPITLVNPLTVALPDGESITLDASTPLALKGSRPRPVAYEELFSTTKYAPNPELVDPRYPVEDLDFSSSGAYSVYNWELFYHAPILVAIHLSRNQRFEEAQQWFHFVFDPTDDSDGPTPERFWRVKPLQRTDVKQAEEILVNLATGDDKQLQEDTVNCMAAWKENPFRPHLVARYRQTPYMMKAVMAYLDNLIDWGDSLFRQDTGEAINEATQLYILAANILGPRPQVVPKKGSVRAHTYKTLKAKMKESWAALVDLESSIPFDLAPYPASGQDDDALGVIRSVGQTLYFGVPRNDKLMSYWDTVADRLFKIRNSLNLQGVFRQLALFEPPIDPGLLAKAVASGLDIGAVVSGLNQPLPLVRFQLLAQKATEICQEVKSLGNNLLSAIEKEDNEAIVLLRAQHERIVVGLAETVKYAQWQEAIKAREGLEKSLANAAQRYTYYERQLGKQPGDIKIPELEALDEASLGKLEFKSGEPEIGLRNIEVDISQDLGEHGGKIISSYEAKELENLGTGRKFQHAASGFEALGGVLAIIPQFDANAAPMGCGASVDFGGQHLHSLASSLAALARATADEYSFDANTAAKIGSYARREQDWAFQSNAAAGEITQIYKQLRAAQIREAIAKREWDNHKQQIRNSQEMEHFLNGENTPIGNKKHKKTTTQGFYTWMRREAKALYGQAFQFAFDVAKKAERALQHELGDQALSYLQFGYLAGKEGLLAGEKLLFDVKRMEMAYHDLNQREYELTRNVSVLQIAPDALLQFRATGRCTISVPEEVFDMDGPGHYFRRIKAMAVSIPCVTGPYTSVNCTLTLLKSSIRKTPLAGEDGYARTGADDARFDDHFGSLRSIVTSSAQNDAGLFEPNLRDERYLPFELSGVISEWELELPADVRQFDFDTITDVVLHFRYTAREGGQLLRKGATDNLAKRIADGGAAGSMRLFSVRHEFPAEWAKFAGTNRGHATQPAELVLPIRNEHFPYWSVGRLGALNEIVVFRKGSKNESPIVVQKAEGTADVITRKPDGVETTETVSDLERGVELPALPDEFTVHLKLTVPDVSVTDLWLAVTWGANGHTHPD